MSPSDTQRAKKKVVFKLCKFKIKFFFFFNVFTLGYIEPPKIINTQITSNRKPEQIALRKVEFSLIYCPACTRFYSGMYIFSTVQTFWFTKMHDFMFIPVFNVV